MAELAAAVGMSGGTAAAIGAVLSWLKFGS